MLNIYFGRSVAHGCVIDITEVDTEHVNSNTLFTVSINDSSAIICYFSNNSLEIHTNGEIIRTSNINLNNVNIIVKDGNIINLRQEAEVRKGNTKSIKFTLGSNGHIRLLAEQYLPKRPYVEPKDNSLYNNHYDNLSTKELTELIEDYKEEINGYTKRYSQAKEELLRRLELDRLS